MAQHGFRSGFSCTTQLIEFYHDVASSFDKGVQVDCVFLDFKKAFDTMPHSLLLHKLSALQLHSQIYHWLEDYLTFRTQAVVRNGSESRTVAVTSGVPQGSVSLVAQGSNVLKHPTIRRIQRGHVTP